MSVVYPYHSFPPYSNDPRNSGAAGYPPVTPQNCGPWNYSSVGGATNYPPPPPQPQQAPPAPTAPTAPQQAQPSAHGDQMHAGWSSNSIWSQGYAPSWPPAVVGANGPSPVGPVSNPDSRHSSVSMASSQSQMSQMMPYNYYVPPPAPQPFYAYTYPYGAQPPMVPGLASGPSVASVPAVPSVPSVPGVPALPCKCDFTPGTNDAPPLDYNIDQMSDFLSTMAYGIMSEHRSVWDSAQQQSFRQFAYMVLGSTRLSKPTIIMALVYLSKRWSLCDVPEDSDAHAFYVFFVISLVLANKTHDDNTFTNASWCQATGLSTGEITKFEAAWLAKIRWSLHLTGTECEGWHKWHECWMVFSGQSSCPAHSPSSTPGVQSPIGPATPAYDTVDQPGAYCDAPPGLWTMPSAVGGEVAAF